MQKVGYGAASMPSDPSDNKHYCHARGCTVPVKPQLLMCLKHWRMVSRQLQDEVWQHYRAGQCDDMNPSKAWQEAAKAAIDAVARKEGFL